MRVLLCAAAALALAACGRGEPPQPTRTVSDITVNTDLQAIGTAGAVQYWQTLDADLETALAEQFVGQIDPEGLAVVVDVDEISLANVYSALGSEQARLQGDVALLNPANEEVVNQYEVTASAAQGAVLPNPAGAVITVTADDEEYYDAVVRAFARGVAEQVRTRS